ncbi:CDC27 family protein [Campylobacter sp. CCS1377]|uniref:CDC27 family protein n=1 Tax=Campylobacter sp. CCS1377 TaxID=3158229 RepID=A0AAU7E5L4_9BACT|nr:CDC27 family protein [Campylobacter jejuni]
MNKIQIQELELKHKKFKQKRYIKFSLLGVLVFCLCFASFILFKYLQNQQHTLNLALKEKKNLQNKLQDAKIIQEKNKILQNKTTLNAQETPHIQTINLSTTNELKIIVQSYEASIPELRSDFYAHPNYKSAIKLSKIYYQNKDYKKSIFWSLKANELNKNNQESWLMFAKAKIALGQKEEAIKALSNYMSFYDSNNIDQFLSQIK